jgi:AcrR family transcriptional regulator
MMKNMTAAPRPKRKSKDAYHHGDLRRALIAAARREVERDEADSVNLKGLALGLGVSQPAPYRHFASREALLTAVATEGFHDLTSSLRAAGGVIDPLADAYVAFGRKHTGLYRLMFVSRLVPNASAESELGAAADESYALLLGAISSGARPERARDVARSFWASLHGLVLLAADGFFGPPGLDPKLVRSACEVAKAQRA